MGNEKIIFAFISALIISFLLGKSGIPLLQKLKAKQSIREDGPQAHQAKAGTPTMGGIFIILSLLIAALYYCQWGAELWMLLFLTVGHGALGFADDFIKAVKLRNLGLTARQKLLGQLIIAGIFSYIADSFLHLSTDLWIPLTQISIPLGFLYWPFLFLVIVGATNAVNLTDGLDGLAAGTFAIASITYSVIALMLVNMTIAIFAAILCGACLGFLYYNVNPAKVFMGDTGSLALGGALAGMAILTKTELLLVIIGGIFVIEALSVILQVLSFKTRGIRIFKMSPIHHHFELSGWKETKVVFVFWSIGIILSIMGLCIMWLKLN